MRRRRREDMLIICTRDDARCEASGTCCGARRTMRLRLRVCHFHCQAHNARTLACNGFGPALIQLFFATISHIILCDI